MFTGRTFEIEIFPFSFKEYLKYYEYKDIDEAFKNFVIEGGMSGSYLYETEEGRLLEKNFSQAIFVIGRGIN